FHVLDHPFRGEYAVFEAPCFQRDIRATPLDRAQLFRLVFAVTALISCTILFPLQEGQLTAPVSWSLRFKLTRASFPHSRHLYSSIGISTTSFHTSSVHPSSPVACPAPLNFLTDHSTISTLQSPTQSPSFKSLCHKVQRGKFISTDSEEPTQRPTQP